MRLTYTGDKGDFTVENPHRTLGLHLPLVNSGGMMSNITPDLNGDAKTEHHSYVLTPLTHACLTDSRNTRNFWCILEDNPPWSAAGRSAWQQSFPGHDGGEEVTLDVGQLWQCLHRSNPSLGIAADLLSFVPVSGSVELMLVTIRNTGDKSLRFTPVAAVPLYGRSADNVRHQRHLSSLFGQSCAHDYGVTLRSALRYGYEGYQPSDTVFGVYGAMEEGEKPVSFCLNREAFMGEGGHPEAPRALLNDDAWHLSGAESGGFESIAAIRFAAQNLAPGESRRFSIQIFVGEADPRYLSADGVLAAWEENRRHWESLVLWDAGSASDDRDFHRWMRWAYLQTILRQICGGSFLPYSDAGRGGRGWRDLWFDAKDMLLNHPEKERVRLVAYFGGVRADGTNANLAGSRPGEFYTDRFYKNRVWMDHGIWPLRVLNYYIGQTGDVSVLLESVSYYADDLILRGSQTDSSWVSERGTRLRRRSGIPYEGTVLEHILVEHICAFYDVGEHNHIRLRCGDWNEGLDMAAERGESVAFTAAYAEGFRLLTKCLNLLEKSGLAANVSILSELYLLLGQPQSLYGSVEKKTALLSRYCQDVAGGVNGSRVPIDIPVLRDILTRMWRWLQKHIRSSEWIEGEGGIGFYNGYYDNHGKPLEGIGPEGTVHLTLTGQVFPILSETATDSQIERILKAVDTYLYFPERGGYALNTDFGASRLDLGRAFSYAYGHKENGSVYVQMAMMFAYALYRRGYAHEAWKAVDAVCRQAQNYPVSRIYPGVPEYFDPEGRGRYPYLTGAGGWVCFVVLTQMYGLRGRGGDLLCQPKLLKDQFDEDGKAFCRLRFAGSPVCVRYENPEGLDYGEYIIEDARLDGFVYPGNGGFVTVPRAHLSPREDKSYEIVVRLGRIR